MNLETDRTIAAANRRRETLSYMSITIASEISMVCAIILLFFVYLDIPVNYATGGVLFSLLIGTALCWQSVVAAEAILVVSVLGTELIVLKYFPKMLIPFIVIDVILIAWLSTQWNVTDKN